MAKHDTAYGRVKGSMHAGLVHSDYDQVMSEYHRLNSDEAKGAFADKLVRNLSVRLNETWPVLYRLLGIIRDRKVYEVPQLIEGGKVTPDFQTYFERVMGQPFDRWAEMEATYQFVSTCKPELFQGTYEVARGAMLVDPEVKRGGDMTAIGTVPIASPSQRDRAKENKIGERTQRWLDHLARDRPDLLAEVNKGKLKVKTAARQAGLIKVPTPLDLLRKAWDRASESERATFLCEVMPDPRALAKKLSEEIY